jgi:hypothetical protein
VCVCNSVATPNSLPKVVESDIQTQTPRSRAFRSFTQSPLVRRTRFVGAGGEDATRTRQAFCTTDWHSQLAAAPEPRATEMRADTSQVAVCSAEFEWMGGMRRTGWVGSVHSWLRDRISGRSGPGKGGFGMEPHTDRQ